MSHIKNDLRIGGKYSKIKPIREYDKKTLAEKKDKKKGKNENKNKNNIRNAPRIKTQHFFFKFA
jgi:hypothetical protein